MKLVDAYCDTEAPYFLYHLLKQRTEDQSISHREMPSFEEHVEFVKSKPYDHWYIIKDGEVAIGSVYLTPIREIGIFILNRYQGKGHGKQAIEKIRELHPGKILANVNPKNEGSKKLWESLGGELIQVTYELEAQ